MIYHLLNVHPNWTVLKIVGIVFIILIITGLICKYRDKRHFKKPPLNNDDIRFIDSQEEEKVNDKSELTDEDRVLIDEYYNAMPK